MAKRYIRLNWQNAPSVATPINATNLNKMDKGINDIDTALNNLENSIVGQIVDDPTKINNAAVIYSLSNQITQLNDNLVNIVLPLNSGLTTEQLINDFYDTYSDAFLNGAYYRTRVTHSFSHSVLGGGIFILEGYKHSDTHGWQVIRCYSPSGLKTFARAKSSGAWLEWEAK